MIANSDGEDAVKQVISKAAAKAHLPHIIHPHPLNAMRQMVELSARGIDLCIRACDCQMGSQMQRVDDGLRGQVTC